MVDDIPLPALASAISHVSGVEEAVLVPAGGRGLPIEIAANNYGSAHAQRMSKSVISRPSSSTSLRSIPGSGLPTLPVSSFSGERRLGTISFVSVMPQTCVKGAPFVSSSLSLACGPFSSGTAPQVANLTPFIEYLCRFSDMMMEVMTGGTIPRSVIW